MERGIRLYAGTRKGLFRLCSHDGRRSWMTEPPHLAGWSVYLAPLTADSIRTFPDGAMAVWRSRDGGDTWEPLRDSLPQRNAYVMPSAWR